MINQDIIYAWYMSYVFKKHDDAHQKFMELAGLSSRQEAKELCYKIAFSVSQSEVIRVYYQ